MECMQSYHSPRPKPYANVAPAKIHARLGELLYMAATASGVSGGSYEKYMAEAIKRFSRSIELCDDYLRGYYGLKLVRRVCHPALTSQLTHVQVCRRLLRDGAKAVSKQTDEHEFALPDTRTLERLDELATAKLSEIVRHSAAQDRGWRGYAESEVAAARELLSEDAPASS